MAPVPLCRQQSFAEHFGAVWDAVVVERARTLDEQRGVRVCSTAPLDYAPLVERMRTWCAQRDERYRRRSRLLPVVDLVADPEYAADADELAAGFAIIERCRECIRLLHRRPTDFQLQLIWFAIELSLPRIFGRAWTTHRVQICRRLRMASDHIGVGGVLSGRKEGKSTGFGMATAVELMCIPGLKAALFSKTHPQAKIILFMAIEFVMNHPWRTQFDIRSGTNPFRLIASPSDHRVVSAKSGSADVRCCCVHAGAGVGGRSLCAGLANEISFGRCVR